MIIKTPTKDPVIDLAIDTIRLDKQALIFVNTKRSAEKCAEVISRKIANVNCDKLSEQISHVLGKPTRQCIRLGQCIKNGIAFHHAGLHSKQRELIEDHFRSGEIKIICCTTTMAAGVDLPAFRSIIRDVRRYGRHGMELIPVLEYHQAAGRAGRPGMEDYGESIAIAKTESDKEELINVFIKGEPEKIYSKLAVEPVLRTFVLSLVSTGIAKSRQELMDFFSKTFWAAQFKDMDKLEEILDKILTSLEKWEFVEGKQEDFVTADEVSDGRLKATKIGRRVAELYLDPYTASQFMEGLERSDNTVVTPFSLIQMICYTLEMRPLLRVRTSEADDILEFFAKHESELLIAEPSFFEHQYGQFLDSLKTTAMLLEWMEETDEEQLFEKFNSRPGETRYKLDRGEWLLYSLKELAALKGNRNVQKPIEIVRTRLKYGVKEELVPLLKLKDVGRVRARALFSNNLRSISDLKNATVARLRPILGPKLAEKVKEQLGQANKDKGQQRNLVE